MKQIRFAITGIIGASMNLLLIYLFVDVVGMSTPLMENIANFISLELSIIFSFTINRNWTWKHRIKERKHSTINQLLYFHGAVGLSVTLRIILFPLMQLVGIQYLINTAFGIIVGAIINYYSFDRLVFKKKENLTSGGIK